MKKVGLITINSLNIGNRLQNYALQESLIRLGYKAETIKREYEFSDEHSLKNLIFDRLRMLIGTRKGLYLEFDNQYIHYSTFCATPNAIDGRVNEEYDCFISGSDQVWNPYYLNVVGDVDLLCFAEPIKRVSYAASFGVDRVPDERKQEYRDALEKYKAISVREKAGKDIVNELIGIDVPVVLDPTLLLLREDWNKIKHSSKYEKGEAYALVYMLGEYDKEIIDVLLLDKYKNIKVVDVLGKDLKGHDLRIGPREFISLIENASFVITNSFHATVFSVIYKKKVYIIRRKGLDMSSRIDNLLEMIGAKEHFDSHKDITEIGEADYTNSDRQLEIYRKLSLDFLKYALSVEDSRYRYE